MVKFQMCHKLGIITEVYINALSFTYDCTAFIFGFDNLVARVSLIRRMMVELSFLLIRTSD